MDPLSLDWGPATAEFQNDEAKSAVHIFAHDLSTPEGVTRAIEFARARLAWCGRTMSGFSQEVWFDDRERKPAPGAKDRIRESLEGKAAGLMFMSEGEA
jgi:hypothetical protein